MLKRITKSARSTEEVFKYYLLALEFVKTNIGYSKFARENNVNEKDFTNICSRLLSFSIKNPYIYNELCKIAIEIKLSNSSVNKYCQQKGIYATKVKEFMTHLNYIEIIQEECAKKGMEYIECATITTNPHLLRIRKDSIASIDELYIPHIEYDGKESISKTETVTDAVFNFKKLTPEPDNFITDPYPHTLEKETNEIEFIVEGIRFNIPRNISDEKLLKLIKTMREL